MSDEFYDLDGVSFVWDRAKAKRNLEKHGISFEEACTAFQDYCGLLLPDLFDSQTEERAVLLGKSQKRKLLVVIHVEREDRLRLISAREAGSRERRQYESSAGR